MTDSAPFNCLSTPGVVCRCDIWSTITGILQPLVPTLSSVNQSVSHFITLTQLRLAYAVTIVRRNAPIFLSFLPVFNSMAIFYHSVKLIFTSSHFAALGFSARTPRRVFYCYSSTKQMLYVLAVIYCLSSLITMRLSSPSLVSICRLDLLVRS